MPLYEYECKECGRRTEKIQKFSDAELTVCPHCGGPLERTLTAPAIQFKGGGWYKDLYSSAKPAAASNSDGAQTGAKSGGESSKPAESTAPSSASSSESTSSGSGSGSASSSSSSTSSTPATASKS